MLKSSTPRSDPHQVADINDTPSHLKQSPIGLRSGNFTDHGSINVVLCSKHEGQLLLYVGRYHWVKIGIPGLRCLKLGIFTL